MQFCTIPESSFEILESQNTFLEIARLQKKNYFKKHYSTQMQFPV